MFYMSRTLTYPNYFRSLSYALLFRVWHTPLALSLSLALSEILTQLSTVRAELSCLSHVLSIHELWQRVFIFQLRIRVFRFAI